LATIHFPQSLAQYTGGVESLTLDARRVGDVMKTVTERFPGLSTPLEVMAVAVDGEVYQEPEYVELSEESEIHFVPHVAGG
jgi:molybdopterin converting factor small subunit